MGDLGRILLLVPGLPLALACAKPQTRVVLMPDPDGHVGVVEVRNAQGVRILDQTHQEVQVPAGQAPSAPRVMPDTAVHAIFGSAMAAQPQAPAHFILQFESGTATLTQASRPLLGKIAAAIRDRSSLDVSVVGHTDTAGSDELNNLLARQRAAAVAKLLMEAGVDPRILEIASHGKAIPLVPTGDNVPEPRNRRVEVTVR